VAEHLAAALIGVGVVFTVWLAFGVGLGFDWPLHVSDGADGRPSTSKFQFFLWTAVIVWGYSAVAAARVIAGASPGGIGMPTNLFILMGLGAGTALSAKLVTVSHGGRPALTAPSSRTYRSLVADDDGNAALEKIQVLAWTFVAVGVFAVSVWQNLAASTPPSSLPNVDDALLVLLGIGQVAYVGVKALPRQPGRSDAAAPAATAPAPSVAAVPPPIPTQATPTGGGPPKPPIRDSL
jgi:hypothetical protein